MANEKQIRARQQQKHDIEANWIIAGENGFIPKAGEIIVYDVDETHDKPRIKIGDGVEIITNLKFIDADLATKTYVNNQIQTYIDEAILGGAW